MVICSKKKSKLRRPPKICTIFPLPASFVWNTLLHYVAKPISIHPEDVRLKSFPKKSFPTCPLSFQRVDPVIHPNKTIPPPTHPHIHKHTPQGEDQADSVGQEQPRCLRSRWTSSALVGILREPNGDRLPVPGRRTVIVFNNDVPPL